MKTKKSLDLNNKLEKSIVHTDINTTHDERIIKDGKMLVPVIYRLPNEPNDDENQMMLNLTTQDKPMILQIKIEPMIGIEGLDDIWNNSEIYLEDEYGSDVSDKHLPEAEVPNGVSNTNPTNDYIKKPKKNNVSSALEMTKNQTKTTKTCSDALDFPTFSSDSETSQREYEVPLNIHKMPLKRAKNSSQNNSALNKSLKPKNGLINKRQEIMMTNNKKHAKNFKRKKTHQDENDFHATTKMEHDEDDEDDEDVDEMGDEASGHVSTESVSTNNECQTCGDVVTARKLKTHHLWHERHPGFTCRFCYFELSDKKSLRNHQKLHANRSKLECVFCGKKFKYMLLLRRHTTSHGDPKCMCDTCGKQFYSEDSLNSHLSIHSNERNWMCFICKKTFKTKNGLCEHMNTHSEEYLYVCSLCGKKFKRKNIWRHHELVRHVKRKENERKKRPKYSVCAICSEVVPKEKFDTHQRWHKKHPGFACRICYFKLNDKDELLFHRKLHEMRPKAECVFCGKSFKKRLLLRIHSETHMVERDKKCTICGKAFVTAIALRCHMNIHTRRSLKKCPICSKTFTCPSNLRTHLKTHTDVRPFTCSFCGMKFKRKDHCRVHERRHCEDTKTEKCPLCPVSHEHKLHLQQHMKKHGIELLYSTTDE